MSENVGASTSRNPKGLHGLLAHLNLSTRRSSATIAILAPRDTMATKGPVEQTQLLNVCINKRNTSEVNTVYAQALVDIR
jgi:hypothetical protein